MKKEKVQYIFIYSLIIIVILGLLCIPAYFAYKHFQWEGYRKDPTKKVLIEKIEGFYKKPTKDLLGDDYTNIGNAYYMMGMFNEAINAYKTSASIVNNTVSNSNIANAYKDIKQYKKSEEYYLKSLAIDPTDMQTYTNLFELYKLPWDGKKYSPESILELGISQPMIDTSSLMATLANYYKEIGNKAKAIEYYQKTLQLNPGNDAAKQELDALQKS
jgi:tetratricopeptide (TPR) repeat protein